MDNIPHYATLKDVAQLAGTTVATVSYVLSGSKKRYVSSDMRQRVEKAAKELNYVKSSAASSLKGKRRKIIAVLIPQFYNEFFTDMVLHIEKTADKYGYILSTCNTFDDPARENEILERMQSQRVDGYLVVPSAQGEENTKLICDMNIPIVFMDRIMKCSDDKKFYILSESYDSVRLATEELLINNHKKIAYLGWRADYGGLEERRVAYQNTMISHGIPGSEHIMYIDDISEEVGAKGTEYLLTNYPDITGIVYANNIQARGGINYLAKKGIKLGEDLSATIVGSPKWAMSGENNITCIDISGADIGDTAAQLLFDIIHGKAEKSQCKEYMPCKLIRGKSVKKL